MSLFAQLLDPEILMNLSERDIDALEAVVDAEILSNPDIQRILRARVDTLVPPLRTNIGARRAGRSPSGSGTP